MYYQKSTQESEKHVLGVIFGRLSNAVVRCLLYVHFDPFCKTATEVKTKFVKSVKMTKINENSIDGGKNFSMGFFGRSLQWRCPFFAIFSISDILQNCHRS